eukprot:7112696-Pyramimonas_sp.AAC.1
MSPRVPGVVRRGRQPAAPPPAVGRGVLPRAAERHSFALTPRSERQAAHGHVHRGVQTCRAHSGIPEIAERFPVVCRTRVLISRIVLRRGVALPGLPR